MLVVRFVMKSEVVAKFAWDSGGKLTFKILHKSSSSNLYSVFRN